MCPWNLHLMYFRRCYQKFRQLAEFPLQSLLWFEFIFLWFLSESLEPGSKLCQSILCLSVSVCLFFGCVWLKRSSTIFAQLCVESLTLYLSTLSYGAQKKSIFSFVLYFQIKLLTYTADYQLFSQCRGFSRSTSLFFIFWK